MQICLWSVTLVWLIFEIYHVQILNKPAGHGMEWKTIFPYSILAIFFHSKPKIFHCILKFASIFHSILKFYSIFHSIFPYQRNFRLEAIRDVHSSISIRFDSDSQMIRNLFLILPNRNTRAKFLGSTALYRK